MQVIKEHGSVPIKAWVNEVTVTPAKTWEEDEFGSHHWQSHAPMQVPDIEDAALVQLKNLARLPFIARNGVAVMPDVHAGKGSTIGTVIATAKVIIPAAVGADLGCGMTAVRLTLQASQLPDSLNAIRCAIEAAVPLGKGTENKATTLGEAIVAKAPLAVLNIMANGGGMDRAARQVGSLGSGNHFIEICLDEVGSVWVMLHSGSRGIGNMIGTKHIERAKLRMEQFFVTLPDADLAYIPEDTQDFQDYMESVQWAQDYALENRKAMMNAVLKAMHDTIPTEFWVTDEAISCHHNYVERESHFGQNLWVTRKGAIRARAGDLGIIPGSMGQCSYIVKGKGNPESYCSCSHGAGRTMSRAEAKRKFSITDLISQTEGVECRKDEDVIDEIPGAYKNLDLVMANQKDLVEVVHTLKAVLCVKGN